MFVPTTRFFSILAFTLLLSILSGSTFAQDTEKKTAHDEGAYKWKNFRSVSDIFTTKFPREYQYKVFPFRFNEDTIAFSTEITSVLPSKEEDNDRRILIHASQTFGDSITVQEVTKIFDRETLHYKKVLSATGGELVSDEVADYFGFPLKKLYIRYTEDGKSYGMRIHVYLTDFSKVEQVVTGPASLMYAYKTEDFLDSIRLFDGIHKLQKPKDFAVGWKSVTSPNNIFTVKLPPKNTDYTPHDPVVKTTAQKETFEFVFKDPVRNEDMLYSVHTYKLGRKATYEDAKKILYAEHVVKLTGNLTIDALKTNNRIIGDVSIMKVKISIPPLQNRPYIRTVFLELQYTDDIVLVQQVLSSGNHVNSGLPEHLFKTLEFHPEKYTYSPPKK